MQTVSITTNIVSSNPLKARCTRYNVRKFVSDLRHIIAHCTLLYQYDFESNIRQLHLCACLPHKSRGVCSGHIVCLYRRYRLWSSLSSLFNQISSTNKTDHHSVTDKL